MKNNENNGKKINDTFKLSALYVFTYAPIGVLCPLIGQYLDGIGFSGTQIGTVTALSTIASIFASTFWGKKYSNSEDGRRVLAFLCIAASITALFNLTITSFILFVFSYSLMYFFQGPVMGLADAMVLSRDESFASIRLFGSIGYALSVFIGGKICGYFGLDKIFIIYALTFIIGGITVMTVGRNSSAVGYRFQVRKREEQRDDKVSFRELFHQKRAIELIICGIFVFGTNVANNTYFGFLFKDGGGTISGLGTIFLLMVASEAPFMAIAPKAAEVFTQRRLIVIAMLISAGRFAVYAAGPPADVLTGLFFLQGMVNGVLLVEYVKYISSVVNVRMIGIAISAFYAVSSSGGTVLCNFFGGVAMDYWGSRGVYGLFSLLNIIGTVLYLLFGLHMKEKSERK